MAISKNLGPRLAALAAGWWLSYGLLAAWWSAGGPGWPYGERRPAAQAGALLVGVDSDRIAPIIAAFSFAAAAVHLAMARLKGRPLRQVTRLAWGAAVLTMLIVPDARLLLTVFQLLTGNTTGLRWPVMNQALCVAGALLTVIAARAARPARAEPAPPRWSATAVTLAIGAPLAYAAIRCAWALGLPIGATEEFLAPYTVTGARITEAIIAGLATGGALLTVGLVRPWGETFPRWLPRLAGRRVPPALAVVPATIVAALLTAAGLSLSRGLVAMTIGLTPATPSASLPNWGAWLAAPLWAIWGVALGAATYAYHQRRATGRP
ncbi:hypothetical protein ACFFMR_32685 [Micromonospora andamanensis]|uniref:Uncharacterized protein n=1 Tax=Micromonospora andamanensis TaxID=1287068 RepID=A0ABQ4I270_9ACTN|nr:hypothetical protein [Micromonospora andamanensis]GIJ11970.1 hypothetical protein Van01_51840 [Micromonospora andamanensis]GIJ41131.1 hypothetical protein Vwe01_44560 [Micromonospora andamanensis]